MPQAYPVRFATAADVPAIAALEAMCFSEPWSEASLLGTLSSENAVLLCVDGDTDKAPVAYGGMYITPPADSLPGEASITNIAVLPAHRGRGIGKAILLALTDIARTHGVGDIFLEVRASNTGAIDLYASVGFVSVGHRKNFYREPREDALIMRHRVVT